MHSKSSVNTTRPRNGNHSCYYKTFMCTYTKQSTDNCISNKYTGRYVERFIMLHDIDSYQLAKRIYKWISTGTDHRNNSCLKKNKKTFKRFNVLINLLFVFCCFILYCYYS